MNYKNFSPNFGGFYCVLSSGRRTYVLHTKFMLSTVSLLVYLSLQTCMIYIVAIKYKAYRQIKAIENSECSQVYVS